MFNVRSAGAVGDGGTDDTAAFARAISACNSAGGGTVVVPAGTYRTGAIHLKSNVNLRLDGATLAFSADPLAFPVVLTRYEGIECMNRSPMIYANGANNIAVTGTGVLDASATAAWNVGSERRVLESWVNGGVTDPRKRVVPGSGLSLRSSFIQPYGCDRVLIQGVTLRGAMFWQIHPTLCTNVTVDGVTTDRDTTRTNTDSCDPESCDHVVIKNSVLRANDDNIAIKSGRDADGRRVNVPSQNIVAFGNTMDGSSGAITCGSEQTGGIQNVYAYQNRLIGATARGLYIKSNTLRGGFTRNINIDSMSGSIRSVFALVEMAYKNQTGGFLPEYRGITITKFVVHPGSADLRRARAECLPCARLRGARLRLPRGDGSDDRVPVRRRAPLHQREDQRHRRRGLSHPPAPRMSFLHRYPLRVVAMGLRFRRGSGASRQQVAEMVGDRIAGTVRRDIDTPDAE
ncbi:MAG TPA: glycoside hydrolase family 28 protein [Micromonosporaceae bacterium]|nr:glycoside hydrolase family 28 protein [Micromonosporaceae bacterium]